MAIIMLFWIMFLAFFSMMNYYAVKFFINLVNQI
jgi:hypothetical protein